MRKKVLSLSLVTLIGTSTLIFPFNNKAVYANTDLMEKKENIQNERSEVKSNIQNKEREIFKLENEQKKLDAEIERFDRQMTETNEKIRQRQGEINEIKKKIEELKAQIEEIKERIKERTLLLENRVRSLQENGGAVSYLEVVLGSQDFSDLISRISAVTAIVNADKEIILAHEKDIKLLDQSEERLNAELNKLKTTLNELELLKKQVSTQIDEKGKLLAQVNVDHEKAESAIYDLEDEEAFLAEQEVAIQKEMERQQQLEEERKRKEAELATLATSLKKSNTSTLSASESGQASSTSSTSESEQTSSRTSSSKSEQASSTSNTSESGQASSTSSTSESEQTSSRTSSSKSEQASSTSNTSESGQASSTSSTSESEQASSRTSSSKSEQASSEASAPATPATSSSFMWPAQGTFTSGYGPRWGKLHGGIDIANRAANVPIVASAAGTVIRSYYSTSYGNAVFISHNIDGKVFTTVYAHMDSRLVSSGQTVSQGQQIGYMGNTGQSTGKHLHFEIHDGAWKNPVNPMTYLK